MPNNVPYQSYSPSAPATNTVIKTTQDGDGSQIQHVIVDPAYTAVTSRADDFYNDAFQRLRVSAPDTRFDSEFLYDKQPLLFEEIIGGTGTAGDILTVAAVRMLTTSAATGFALEWKEIR